MTRQAASRTSAQAGTGAMSADEQERRISTPRDTPATSLLRTRDSLVTLPEEPPSLASLTMKFSEVTARTGDSRTTRRPRQVFT